MLKHSRSSRTSPESKSPTSTFPNRKAFTTPAADKSGSDPHHENITAIIRRVATPSHPLNAHDVLYLQQHLGNRRVARMIAERKASRTSSKQTGRQQSDITHTNQPAIQRAFGLEFEIDQVDTYSKGFRGKHNILKKKDKLLNGVGFKLEADEMPGRSNMEFVTDAFPETIIGGNQLINALNDINGVINALTGNVNTEVSAATLNAFGAPVANRFLFPTAANFIGKPQVTAGIKLDAMDRFFSDIALRPIAAGDAAGGNNAARMLGGQLGALGGGRDALATSAGMLDVSQARTAATAAIVQVTNEIQSDPTNPNLNGPELRALVTQLTMYMVRGAEGLGGYAKLIAGGLMGRTDFAAIFRLLPQVTRDYFVDYPDIFVRLVMISSRAAAQAAGVAAPLLDNGPVFEGGQYNDPGMYGNDPNFQSDLLPQLKRDAWLKGIVNNTDLMTAVNYPVSGSRKQKKNQKAEIESLGGYGANTDDVSNNPLVQSPAPIVELRGLKPIYAGLLTPMTLDLFRYVHTVNTGGAEDYPGHLLDATQNDKLDMITNTGNVANIRHQIVQDALNNISLW